MQISSIFLYNAMFNFSNADLCWKLLLKASQNDISCHCHDDQVPLSTCMCVVMKRNPERSVKGRKEEGISFPERQAESTETQTITSEPSCIVTFTLLPLTSSEGKRTDFPSVLFPHYLFFPISSYQNFCCHCWFPLAGIETEPRASPK